MLGHLFLCIYRVIDWCARWMRRERGDYVRARWTLQFASMTDGGFDDDFAEELFGIVLNNPALLDRLETQLKGDGWGVRRRRMLIESLRDALTSSRQTIF